MNVFAYMLLGMCFLSVSIPSDANHPEVFVFVDEISPSHDSSPAVMSTHVVDVNVDALSTGRPVHISLPNEITYAVTEPRVQLRAASNFRWKGQMHAAHGMQGNAAFSVVNGVPAGFIQAAGKTYELVPQSGTRCLLHEIDQEGYAPEQQPVSP